MRLEAEYMSNQTATPYQKKIITIPNILSFFRLCLIPVIAWLYLGRRDYWLTTLVLVLSGLTDIVDGYIARRFNMVSDFGKIFDPIADKLTQFVTMLCLVSRFPHMLVPVILLAVKEIFAAITGLLTIRKTGNVMSAQWHGKAATVTIYAIMIIHLLWYNIPAAASNILIILCSGMMLLSAVLYGIRNIGVLLSKVTVNEKA